MSEWARGKRVTVTFPREEYKKLLRAAYAGDRTIAAQVRASVRKGLNGNNDRPGDESQRLDRTPDFLDD